MVFERLVALSTVLLLVAGAGIMVAQRAVHDRWYYISEFGAAGLASERDFKAGFVMLALGMLLSAWSLRRIRSKPWPASITMALAATAFIVASQVNCTEGCPGLGNPDATARDLVHIWFAIAGFVLGCITMLQVAFAAGSRFRAVTVVAMVLVAAVSGTGGILSLLRSSNELGAILEHVATGIGVLWLIVVVLVESSRFVPSAPPPGTPTAAGESKRRQHADAVPAQE